MSRLRFAILFASASLTFALTAGCSAGDPSEPAFCGGFAGILCPAGQRCIDDPKDDCDPARGGADCGGICVPDVTNPCAVTLCKAGTECVVSDGAATCVPIKPPGEKCGETVCGPGTTCCNPLRSICVRPGMACIF